MTGCPYWMDTSFNKLVVRRFWWGGQLGVLNMKILKMDNIRELLLIFIRYNKDIVVTEENVPILNIHLYIIYIYYI